DKHIRAILALCRLLPPTDRGKNKATREMPYMCTNCIYVVNSIKELCQHLRIIHSFYEGSQLQLKCFSNCPSIFKTYSGFRKHLAKCKLNLEKICTDISQLVNIVFAKILDNNTKKHMIKPIEKSCGVRMEQKFDTQLRIYKTVPSTCENNSFKKILFNSFNEKTGHFLIIGQRTAQTYYLLIFFPLIISDITKKLDYSTNYSKTFFKWNNCNIFEPFPFLKKCNVTIIGSTTYFHTISKFLNIKSDVRLCFGISVELFRNQIEINNFICTSFYKHLPSFSKVVSLFIYNSKLCCVPNLQNFICL
ncbi:hypothetical protein ALC57_09750, partial [Trachymyrmex cornetzi]